MGNKVGNPESSRSIFVLAARQGLTGPLKKLIDIPGYEFVGRPEYLNPFWIGSVRYTNINTDALAPLPASYDINALLQDANFEKWCKGINFNHAFSSSYSDNLLKWGISPKPGSNTVN